MVSAFCQAEQARNSLRFSALLNGSQLDEGQRPKAGASPDGEDSSGGLQKEGAKWVTSTTGKA